jgi:hypothetical protein
MIYFSMHVDRVHSLHFLSLLLPLNKSLFLSSSLPFFSVERTVNPGTALPDSSSQAASSASKDSSLDKVRGGAWLQ